MTRIAGSGTQGLSRRRHSARYVAAFFLALAAACLLVFTAANEASGQQPGEGTVDEDPSGAPYAAGELIVTYEEDEEPDSPPVESLLQSVEGTVEENLPSVDAQLLDFPEVKQEASRNARENLLEEKKQELERVPEVESVDYNYLREPNFIPNDPQFFRQWNLAKTTAYVGWDETRGEGARIAIIDSGIDADHPDLASKIDLMCDASAPIEPNTTLPPDECPGGTDASDVADRSGHGTHVAGIAAAATDNGTGMAGACPECRLLIAKVNLTIADVVKGINWAVENDADVINISLGGAGDSDAEREAIRNATVAEVLVVASAGNDRSATETYPAAYPEAMAVAATTRQDARAEYSNLGTWVDVAAPGGDGTQAGGVYSTIPNRYGYKSGTSMSSPLVAGVAGLVASQGVSSAEEIRDRIESTTVDLGPRGKDLQFGHGRVDAAAAVGARERNTAPVIFNVYPKPGARSRAGFVTIRATVSDGQTQLRGGNIALIVDRRRVSFSYNAVNDVLIRRIRLAPGGHSVRITANDGWGLSGTKLWRFSAVR